MSFDVCCPLSTLSLTTWDTSGGAQVALMLRGGKPMLWAGPPVLALHACLALLCWALGTTPPPPSPVLIPESSSSGCCRTRPASLLPPDSAVEIERPSRFICLIKLRSPFCGVINQRESQALSHRLSAPAWGGRGDGSGPVHVEVGGVLPVLPLPTPAPVFFFFFSNEK